MRTPVTRGLVVLVLLWGLLVLTGLHFLNSLEALASNLVPGLPSRPDDLGDLVDLEPKVDLSPSHSEGTLVEDVQRRIPNLPIAYWTSHKNKPMHYKNESCAKFPSIFELEFNNIYWQTLQTTNGTFQLYGAYYDVRSLCRICPLIRILAMINIFEPTVKTYCQIWFETLKEPVFVKVMEYKYIWYTGWGNMKRGIYQPYMLACRIPRQYGELVPASVSVVQKPCDTASNNLRVIYNKPAEKKDFAVCVKGLDFLHEDISVRLVEWIELLSILGADKIFFYEFDIHPNISKVLRYYEQQGRVEVTPLTLPGGQPNAPGFRHMYLMQKMKNKRQNELIPYNDCFIKNIYAYRYVAILDIDEVIMPMNTNSWKELMDIVEAKALNLKKVTYASFYVRNVYFLDDLTHDHDWEEGIPRYMHMLQHVYRTQNFTRPYEYEKCFHNTESVLTVFNHFPFACIGFACTSHRIDTSDAQLQHYRSDCVFGLKKSCANFRENSIKDTTIWKYKDRLIKRTTNTLRKLGFF